MIITLLAWLYITILCRIWGVLILITVKKISRDDKSMPVHFSISCFLGLAGITVFASLLSLFIPLGGWLAQLLIVAPCTLLLFIKPGQRIFSELKKNFSRSHTILITLIFFCLILVLHTSSWKITNEDTLGYHAQIIQWIEKYKAVPGIANLHLRYGFQSPWFVSCALFSFSFTGTNALTFINSAILFWYFIFMISQVNEYFLGQTNIATSFLWLAFLMFSLWNYSLVRLTADSASPDFVAVIYTWIVFYLLLNKKFRETNTSNFLLLILTSVFAFTVKLSAFPIILISVYGAYELLRVKKIRALLFSLLIAVLILIPFGARNIIASGYLVFPSSFPDIANVDWKVSKENTSLIKNYISVYAKTDSRPTIEDIQKNGAKKIYQWLPSWWRKQSLADKTILLIMCLSLFSFFFIFKRFYRSDQRTKIGLLTALAGITFWFNQAPDPRFGFGFIIALPAVILSLYIENKNRYYTGKWKKEFTLITSVPVVMIAFFIGYRTIHYFSPSQIITPMGIETMKYDTVDCSGIGINVSKSLYNCGSTCIPCTYDSCQKFEPRGKLITDGFRAK